MAFRRSSKQPLSTGLLARKPAAHLAADPEQTSASRALLVGRILIVGLTLLFAGLLGRVVWLQVRPAPPITAMLGNERTEGRIADRRGAITDRNGRLLAVTRERHKLFVDSRLIIDRNTFSAKVGYALGYDPVALDQKLAAREGSRYIVIDERITPAQYQQARSLDLPGLATEPVLVRDYPQGPLAGQLVGFVGAEGKGLDGLELALNSHLTGKPGNIAYVRDARRRRMWIDEGDYQTQQDGLPARLSIDLAIQNFAEQALAEAVTKYGAESGQLVAIDPLTGDVLAMANYPQFSPAEFRSAPAESRRNRCVTDVFEPGSIFKPFVWAALTELKAAKPEEILDTGDAGYWRTPYGRTLRDAHGHGEIDWDHVLIYSSNIGMAMAAERISQQQLHSIVRAFGFGETTGSMLPGEVPGLLNPLRKWTRYSQSSIPMGQEIGVTGLQMARAFSALANDGLLVTPTILATDPVSPTNLSIHERVLSPAVASHTRRVLRTAVLEGTGRRAKSKLYPIWGKTGTAQLPDFENGGYHQDQYVSSFIGGAPVERPRIVVGCFIRKPDRSKGHYGGVVAAPAVREVIERSLLYLGEPMGIEPKGEQLVRGE